MGKSTCQLGVEFRRVQQRGQKHNGGAEHRENQRAEESPRHHTGKLMMVILKDSEGSLLNTRPDTPNLDLSIISHDCLELWVFIFASH